ncbi:hypothetical protein CGC21_0005 [Leishmania donovani]|uniref:Uncharacterized protein n=1 Tax=Leishmania donovani TaxID=5661 RepID=A0A504XNU1_LEIDO|nr:hypothetical protein CGC21_0005 [Leishmania donovani]
MTKLTVVCRAVSSALEKQTCELTCIERQTISLEAVRKQHKAYVQVFKEMIEDGYDIELIELPALNELPTRCLPDLDTVTALRQENYRICEPGTVDGGDVLYVANSKYVVCGQVDTLDDSGYEQMKEYLGKHGLECPAGANVLSFSAEKNGKPLRTIVTAAEFPGTASRIEAGRPTRQVVLEADEIAKAEGSLTCCSLLSYSA